jgi:hypothetical protein
MVQNDVPLHVVANLLGHSSTRMVERVYGKLSKRNMDEAIAALPTFEARREIASAARLALTAGHEQECAIHVPGGECSCPAGRT